MKERNKILKIVKENSSKSISRMIQRDISLLNEVNGYFEGAEFNFINFSEKLYCYINSIKPPVCKRNEKILFNSFIKGYRDFCGSKSHCECARENQGQKVKKWKTENPELEKNRRQKADNTMIERYGASNPMKSEEIKSRYKESNMKKIGVEYPFQSKEIQDKVKQTNMKKIGVEYPFQSVIIQGKIRETLVDNHGEDYMKIARDAFLEANDGLNPFQIEKIKEKAENSMIKNHGVKHPLQSAVIVKKMQDKYYKNHRRNNPSQLRYSDSTFEILTDKEKYKNFIKGKTITQISDELDIDYNTAARYANKYNLKISVRNKSKYEIFIAKFLKENKLEFVQNKKIIKPYELDFYLKDHNLGIEFHGLATHSEFYGKKNKKYHQMKYDLCKEKGIRLIQIFQDEWEEKEHIVKSKILNLTGKTPIGVGARSCIIKNVSWQDEKKFLDTYHIQGSVCSRSKAYGAYYRNELVGILSIGKSKEGFHEIKRFATNNRVYAGLFSKMLKNMIIDLKPKKIVTFADLRWSIGNLYYKSGFTLVDELDPGYFYVKGMRRENKSKFRKQRIAKRFNIDISNKTELELILEVGYDRIWDSGKLKFQYTPE